MSDESISPPAMPTPPAAKPDSTVAVISYLTFIGFIVALIMFAQPQYKTALSAFHLRQNLGILVFGVVASIAMMILGAILIFIPLLGPLLSSLLFLCLSIGWFVLSILGLIAAVNGEQKPVPVIGDKINEMFKGAFVV
jgi:uncharacterized membrane protein